MELGYAFFAKAAQFSGEGLGIIGGDINRLIVPLPFTPDSLTLVVKIEFTAAECATSHRLLLEIFGPDGVKAKEESLDIEPPPPPPRGRDLIGAIVLLDLVETTFHIPGTFRFRLALDGRELKTLELEIQAQQALATA